MACWKKYFYLATSLFILAACQPSENADIDSAKESVSGNLFFPAMQTVEIRAIKISRHGLAPLATFSLINGQWQMLTPYAIPANPELFEHLSGQIKSAEIVAEKTSDPDWFKYLGLADIDSVDAQGSLLEISAGEKNWRFIVGNTSTKQKGQYWRKLSGPVESGPAGAVRVDQVLDLPADIINWMERTIIDLPANGVAGINLQSADGKNIDLVRSDATMALKIVATEINHTELPHNVQQLVYGLTQLNFDALDVPVSGAADFQLRFNLFDKNVIELQLFQQDNNWGKGSWAQLNVMTSTPAANTAAGQTLASSADANLAAQMNQQLGHWRYHLSPQRTALFIQAINELIEVPLNEIIN